MELGALAEVARRLRRNAEHVEVRLVRDRRRQLALRDGRVERLFLAGSAGVAVRVLAGGAWGFAARAGESVEALEAAAAEALVVARAAASIARGDVRLTEEEPQRGRWVTPVAIDPFAAPADALLARLDGLGRGLQRAGGEATRSTSAQMFARQQHKLLATSDGTAVEQELTYSGCGMKITVERDGQIAQRSYPMDLDGGVVAGGLEVLDRFAFEANVERIAAEALALTGAPLCPAGTTTLILDTPQLALQIHESCGHPTEGDRAFGEEVSLAGASFLVPEKLGRFRYGSKHVNLTADATEPGGLGTFGWDDEGVAARRTPLVARGQHVGYLTSREVAARLGLPRSGGCVRAESWGRAPIIRMVNVSLEPAPGGPTLEELIADTDEGLLLGNNRSWSIDDLRLNFQFSCEIGWEIRRGKRTRIVRQPLYRGSTPKFWAGCDAVGGPADYRLWGLTSCGKGDPMQLIGVGHGCPPARFRGVEVGSSSGDA
jgi:TldD protein